MKIWGMIAKYFLNVFFRLQTLKKQAKLNLPFNSYFTCKHFVSRTLSILCLYFAYTLFTKNFFTLKSLSQTARNHDALLNCEPQLRKVVSPTQNHSRQIKSIIYIPVITTKLIVAKITIIALPILKHNLMENLLSPCGAIK